jgi:hypothetical protein
MRRERLGQKGAGRGWRVGSLGILRRCAPQNDSQNGTANGGQGESYRKALLVD